MIKFTDRRMPRKGVTRTIFNYSQIELNMRKLIEFQNSSFLCFFSFAEFSEFSKFFDIQSDLTWVLFHLA